MEYVYAALLLHKAGKKIDEGSIKKVLQAAGVTVDDARVKALVAALDGVDIEKVISETPVMTATPAPQAAGEAEKPSKGEKKEEKKEEEKKEEKEEAAAEGLGALFG